MISTLGVVQSKDRSTQKKKVATAKTAYWSDSYRRLWKVYSWSMCGGLRHNDGSFQPANLKKTEISFWRLLLSAGSGDTSVLHPLPSPASRGKIYFSNLASFRRITSPSKTIWIYRHFSVLLFWFVTRHKFSGPSPPNLNSPRKKGFVPKAKRNDCFQDAIIQCLLIGFCVQRAQSTLGRIRRIRRTTKTKKRNREFERTSEINT